MWQCWKSLCFQGLYIKMYAVNGAAGKQEDLSAVGVYLHQVWACTLRPVISPQRALSKIVHPFAVMYPLFF